ncbi:MAG TPA: hypothetical protein VH541_05705 [Gaiellaceae bacterium]|jgi:hypothetical protein
MSRKDYNLVAASIREARDDRKCDERDSWGIDIASTLSRNLGDENPRFDGLRFLRACGFSDDVIGGPR